MFNRIAFNTYHGKIYYPGGHVAPAISIDFVGADDFSSNVEIQSDYTNEPTGYLRFTHAGPPSALINSSQGPLQLDVNGDATGNLQFDYSISTLNVTADFMTAIDGKVLATDSITLPGIQANVTPSIGEYYSNISFAFASNITDLAPVLNWQIVSGDDLTGYFTSATSGNVTLAGGLGTVVVDYDKYYDNANTSDMQFYIEFTDPRSNNIVAQSANVQIEQAADNNTFFIDAGYTSGTTIRPWLEITELSNGDRLHKTPIADTGDIAQSKYVAANVIIGFQPEHIEVKSLAVGGGGAGGLGLSFPYSTQDYIIGAGGGGAGGGVDTANVSAVQMMDNANGVSGTGVIFAQAGYRGIAQWNGTMVDGSYDVLQAVESNVYVRYGFRSTVSKIGNSSVTHFQLAQGPQQATGQGGRTSYLQDPQANAQLGAGQGFMANVDVTSGSDFDGGTGFVNVLPPGSTYYPGGGAGGGEDGTDGYTTVPSIPNGGDGFISDITGTSVKYAAGGGGGKATIAGGAGPNSPGEGGELSGGDGGSTGTQSGTDGVDFLGSGGGGASAQLKSSGVEQADGGQGGDGVVYVRYPYRFRRLRV